MRNDKLYTIAISAFSGDDNVGDDLLQIALIRWLNKRFKIKRVVIFTSNVEKNINLFKREGLSFQSFHICYSGRWGLKEPNKKGLKSYHWIINNLIELKLSDIHLIGPGNLIKDSTNRCLAAFWILRGFISHIFGKHFAFLAIGVADINHIYSKFLIQRIVKKALFITTRDNKSIEKLRQLGVNNPPMESFTDLTYALFDEAKLNNREKTGEIRKVGLNFANFSHKFFSYQVIENYKKIIVSFLNKISEKNDYEFTFFCFSEQSHFNDNILYEYVAGELRKHHRHINNYAYKNIDELKKGVSTCDAFIGTRFHSVIFAIQGYVPTVALSWDYKANNFFTEAGIGDYALEIEDLTLDKLLSAWDKLTSNYLNYYSYLKELNNNYHSLSLKHFDMLERYLLPRTRPL